MISIASYLCADNLSKKAFLLLNFIVFTLSMWAYELRGGLSNPNGAIFQVSLYSLHDLNEFESLNSKNLINRTRTDSSGRFILNSILPLSPAIYRLHISKIRSNETHWDRFESETGKLVKGNTIYILITDNANISLKINNHGNSITGFMIEGVAVKQYELLYSKLYQHDNLAHRVKQEVDTLRTESKIDDQQYNSILTEKLAHIQSSAKKELFQFMKTVSDPNLAALTYYFIYRLSNYSDNELEDVYTILKSKGETVYLQSLEKLITEKRKAGQISLLRISLWISIGINFLLGFLLISRALFKRSAKSIFTLPAETKKEEPADYTALTRKEFEILELVAKGLSNKDISAQLFIEISTIKTHVSNIYSKLGLKNRMEAKAFFEKHLTKQ